MIKVVWTSDLHLGLKTDEIDRNEEIFSILDQVIDHASTFVEKNATYLILGGDIFNKNNPSESLISLFIERVVNRCKEINLKVVILVGNHDSIADKENTSCLSFIDKISPVYKNISLVSDLKLQTIKKESDYGPIYFTFLPHVTRVHLEGKRFKSTQDYIEAFGESVNKKVGKTGQNYVFSHLNVKGVHGGSEENLLKKSEVYLPKEFIKNEFGFEKPIIIQGHIHSHTIEDNIHIIGSPLYCGFGESEERKFFLDMSIPEHMGEKLDIQFVTTNCRQFKELSLDLTKDFDGVSFFEHPQVNKFLGSIEVGSVVKFDLRVNPKNCSIDWNDIRDKVMGKYECYMKPIVPKYIYDRVVRNEEQKITLNPTDAVKIFLKTNKPPLVKEKWEIAKHYL